MSSTTTRNLPLTLLTATRFLVGFTNLIAPLTFSSAFLLPLERKNALVGRLFGCRDMFLALICLYDVNQLRQFRFVEANATLVQSALSLGIVVDSIDVISSTIEYAAGNISHMGFVLAGVGAAFLAVLGINA